MLNLWDVTSLASQHGMNYQTAWSPTGQEVAIIQTPHKEEQMAMCLDMIDQGVFDEFKVVTTGAMMLIWKAQ